MIKITEHKKGLKMEGFLSINTAPSCNSFCEKMKENKDCICSQCYGRYMERRYPRAKRTWIENFNVLTTEIFDWTTAQKIADIFNRKKNIIGVRIHSVGEIFNTRHIENISRIVSSIKVDIPVTIWTKRPEYIRRLPERLQCTVIYSNPLINSYINPSTCDDFIIHTFNVYDNEQLMYAHMYHARYYQGLNVFECHGNCKDCMVCYPKYGETPEQYMIFELTKKASGKTGRRKKA